jgi:hypothetical protein
MTNHDLALVELSDAELDAVAAGAANGNGAAAAYGAVGLVAANVAAGLGVAVNNVANNNEVVKNVFVNVDVL